MQDCILRHARIVDPVNSIDMIGDIAFENGKVSDVSSQITTASKKEYDFTGKVVQPGIIDPHVHISGRYGSLHGHRMLAREGVTTCLDMAGPIRGILNESPKEGAGLNVAVVEAAFLNDMLKSSEPSHQEILNFIEAAMDGGAIGVKLLGGHYPMRPDISTDFIKSAYEKGGYVAWHAGSTEHGSNIEGMVEAVDAAQGMPLHLAHINAYCRGTIKDSVEEARIAIDKLKANPNIVCESYLSPKNGTFLTCDENGKIISKVTALCLTRFGFTADIDGLKKAFRAGHASVNYDAGGYTGLLTGEEGIAFWEKHNDVAGSFNVNPPIPRIWLAQAKREDGAFVVDGISTDGGIFTRNVILDHGLSLVRMGVLTLPEFVVKTSVNPARMLRLHNKGHLSLGADADVTVYDLKTQEPIAAFVAGEPIMLERKIVGKSATMITTERGEKAVREHGLETIRIDLSMPYGNRFVIRH